MTITRADLDAGLVDFSDIPMTGERVDPVHPGEILGDALGRRDILPSALAEARHSSIRVATSRAS